MTTVEKSYRKLADEKKISYDPAQIAVARELDVFMREILQAPAPEREKGFFSNLKRLFIGDTREEDADIEGVNAGIYIYGEVGRGKSMLADLFFNTVPLHDDEKRRVHFHAFMRELHAELHKLRKKEVEDPLAVACQALAEEARLLCFDELQVTDVADAAILGRFFERLIRAGTRFVITSNRPPEDLYLNGLNREIFIPCITLMRRNFEILSLNHEKDYRLERDLIKKRYLRPLNDETAEKTEELWTDLLHGLEETPATLTVNGRDIPVNRQAKNAARFTFAELCEEPLAAADYLAIAEKYSVLLLTDVPGLSEEKRNEATRFRTLIDALYENKVTLYITAATKPEALYPEGDFAFEFKRTASRLEEMRSEDYPPRDES